MVSAVTLIIRPGLHSILYYTECFSFRLRACHTVAAVERKTDPCQDIDVIYGNSLPLSFFEKISNFSKFSSISAQFFHAEEIYDKSWRTQHDSRRGGVNGDSLLHFGDFFNCRDATPYGDAIMQGLRPQRRNPVLLT